MPLHVSYILLQVILPALQGHVPSQMIAAIRSFLDFCYLVRRESHTEKTLCDITSALDGFHRLRQVFVDAGIYPDGISLPRQHSLTHYRPLIESFASPNGLCSSITESKHIKAVKEPWRRSNKYKALGQMLVTNQRLEKLASMRADLSSCTGPADAMVMAELIALDAFVQATRSNDSDDSRSNNTLVPSADDTGKYFILVNSKAYAIVENLFGDGDGVENESGPVDGMQVDAHAELARSRSEYPVFNHACWLIVTPVRNIPRDLEGVAVHFNYPQLPELTQRFLYDQLHSASPRTSEEISYHYMPYGRINIFSSAISVYWAPSDPSGVGGMCQERIRASLSWQKGPPRYDCMFVSKDPSLPGFRGLHVVRTMLFFSFVHNNVTYPCALVQWFLPIGDEPDEATGMYVVEPELDGNGARTMSVIHMDSVLRAAHLVPCYGNDFLPSDFHFTDSLDAFRAYYVNKFIDHSAHAMIY
jgi:hypothetical protein